MDVVSKYFVGNHRHDWRVDPSQLITSGGGRVRVRIACADCGATGTVSSLSKTPARPNEPKTWRQYHYADGDSLRVDVKP